MVQVDEVCAILFNWSARITTRADTTVGRMGRSNEGEIWVWVGRRDGSFDGVLTIGRTSSSCSPFKFVSKSSMNNLLRVSTKMVVTGHVSRLRLCLIELSISHPFGYNIG
jgi:hypothetical protein